MAKTGIIIGKKIKNLGLVSPIGENCLKPASCDLRLGPEIFVCGTGEPDLRALSKEKNCVTLGPFDSAIFSTLETINLSEQKKIIGRFDIRIEHAIQGLMVQVGPQIEPGYKGPLFGLIINTRAQPYTLQFGQRLFTLEFSNLEGEPNDITPKTVVSLANFLANFRINYSTLANVSIIRELLEKFDAYKEIQKAQQEGRDRKNWFSQTKWTQIGVFVAVVFSLISIILQLWPEIRLILDTWLSP